jgi:RHS repeat-associated protein
VQNVPVEEQTQGTVDSQSDSDWAAFTTILSQGAARDSLGHPIQVSSAGQSLQSVLQYTYRTDGRLDCAAERLNLATWTALPASACTLATAGADGPDRIVKNTYDNAGRLSVQTTAYGTALAQDTQTLAYTSNGLLQSLTDAKGNVTTYEYDGFDRLAKVRYPVTSGSGSSTTDFEQYAYNISANTVAVTLRGGASVTFSYDNLYRQTSGLRGEALSYDNFGRLTAAELSGQTNGFTYDALDRLKSESSALGTLNYTYDAAGRRTRITWPDSYFAAYDYNVVGEMTAVRENGATSGVGVLAIYGYDNLGRRTAITRGNSTSTSYIFGPDQQLYTIAHDLAGTGSDQTVTYEFSAGGQIKGKYGTNAAYDFPSPSGLNRSYASNGLNQLTAAGGTTLTYNNRGNLSNDGVAYTYDVANNLTGASTSSFSFDPGGRLAQVAGASTIKFAYSGVQPVGEYDTSNNLLRRYVPGAAMDETVTLYEGSGTSTPRWLVPDDLGSVIAVTDSSGAVVGINTYDAYGIPGSGNIGRMQFTGQMWIAEALAYHYKARTYSPDLGRFFQPDPVGYAGGLNLYAYVGNDSMNLIDPFGLQDCPPEGCAVEDVVVILHRSKNKITTFISQIVEDVKLTGSGRRRQIPIPPAIKELIKCPVLEGQLNFGAKLAYEQSFLGVEHFEGSIDLASLNLKFDAVKAIKEGSIAAGFSTFSSQGVAGAAMVGPLGFEGKYERKGDLASPGRLSERPLARQPFKGSYGTPLLGGSAGITTLFGGEGKGGFYLVPEGADCPD